MLNDKEREEIHEEMRLYPYPAAACIDALKIVQRYRGWISDEAIHDIASELAISPDEVDGVATFYTRIYRKPVGRNIILLCDGISCMVMDYESIYKYLSGKLGISFGQTTADNRFTLLPVSCLGDCDHAPAMIVNEDHYNNLNVKDIDEILGRYL
jgi:NADH-quinone oxidoreductase subunit E